MLIGARLSENNMAKKILFLYPNTANSPNIPSAIAILSGIAKKLSWETAYFDTYIYQKTKDSLQEREDTGEFKHAPRPSHTGFKPLGDLTADLQEKIDALEPDIIAISCISFEYQFLMSFLPDIRIQGKALVMIGGVHATVKPDEVASTGLFDLVCAGEGEEVFAELLAKYELGEDLKSIKNIYYRNSDGEVIRNPRRKIIGEDRLWANAPDLSFFDERYFLYPFDGKIYRRYSFELARGCPFDCTYCGNSAIKKANDGLGNYVRTRPVRSIQENMKGIIDERGLELLYFQDECIFSHPLSWLEEFAEWYGREIKKPFIAQTRPETVTEEKIKIMKRMNAPYFQISVGVESGSEKILFDVCNRRTKIDRIIECFDLLRENNVRTCAFFMIGFPYETREDIFKSIGLCRRIRPTVAIASIFQPMPGQELTELCVKEGYLSADEPLPTFTGRSMLNMPQISSEEIENLRRVFMLYAMLPEKYYPEIEKCEKEYQKNRKLYKELVDLRWEIT